MSAAEVIDKAWLFEHYEEILRRGSLDDGQKIASSRLFRYPEADAKIDG